jgi:hypothetical protein
LVAAVAVAGNQVVVAVVVAVAVVEAAMRAASVKFLSATWAMT